ncbi:MAG: hypothetical protein LBQ55_11440 [Treponema sp.]|jgi:hypothetical protein|nr:hypothetical protein [Treponema sp.]
MAHKHDYVPARNADFDRFFGRIVEASVLKTGGTNPPWYHIPPAAVTELSAARAAWSAAYAAAFDDPAPSVIRERIRVRRAGERVLRAFVQRYLKYDPVTDEERDELEIPRRGAAGTRAGEPTEHVLLLIEPVHAREHKIVWEVEETGSKARPYGYGGVVLVRKILEHGENVPTDPEALSAGRLLTRNNVILHYPPEDQGKRCAYAACWQNKAGATGKWCSVVAAVIP